LRIASSSSSWIFRDDFVAHLRRRGARRVADLFVGVAVDGRNLGDATVYDSLEVEALGGGPFVFLGDGGRNTKPLR
jgi:hypothetical protein